MKRVAMVLPVLAAVLLIAGCGGNKSAETSSSSSSPPASTPSTPPAESTTTAVTATSPLDTGPRAIEEPVNAQLAAEGEKLWTQKTCATCHGFGKKIACPDQARTAHDRSARWMTEQIMHPDKMLKTDPITMQLAKGYPAPMPPLGITEPQAKALVEYIKKKDLELGGK